MCMLFAIAFIFSLSITNINANNNLQTYIVLADITQKPSSISTNEDWYKSSLRETNHILHVYKSAVHGFAARLTADQATNLKNSPGIVGIFPDQIRQIQTTRTPQFLGLTVNNGNPNEIEEESDYGSNIIVGVIDTGISPEHRSFSDDGLGGVPENWRGQCEGGENFPSNLCNKKLVGVRYFVEGYIAQYGALNRTAEIPSARDFDGHGTHTASTAVGRLVKNASLFGLAYGVASGMAPKARVSAYKVCWKLGCADSDILAGIDVAVEDGVHIISLSISNGPQPFDSDLMGIGAFGAMEKGVLVSASAANFGPQSESVAHCAPWILTVAASTIDRDFTAEIVLGNGQVVKGVSLYTRHPVQDETYLPLIYAGNASVSNNDVENATLCKPDSLDPTHVRGKIVVCLRGDIGRVDKMETVMKLGGVGFILANKDDKDGLIADPFLIPGIATIESDGQRVINYASTTVNPTARFVFHGTQVGMKPAPMAAEVGSRGPNPISIYVIKPDLVAPGVNILAAWPDYVAPTELSEDHRRTEFNIISGTSMACPHVSGIAALIKGAHPDWSPAMIKSALMTTAYTHDHDGNPMLDEYNHEPATMWAMGVGHIDPQKANDPGLVYDITSEDYIDFLCGSQYNGGRLHKILRRKESCSKRATKPWDLNYPAIIVPFNVRLVPHKLNYVVKRIVTHVGSSASSYNATLTHPSGAIVDVQPPRMEFKSKGEKQSFVVHIRAEEDAPRKNSTEIGMLTWTDGLHKVVSPIIIVWFV